MDAQRKRRQQISTALTHLLHARAELSLFQDALPDDLLGSVPWDSLDKLLKTVCDEAARLKIAPTIRI